MLPANSPKGKLKRSTSEMEEHGNVPIGHTVVVSSPLEMGQSSKRPRLDPNRPSTIGDEEMYLGEQLPPAEGEAYHTQLRKTVLRNGLDGSASHDTWRGYCRLRQMIDRAYGSDKGLEIRLEEIRWNEERNIAIDQAIERAKKFEEGARKRDMEAAAEVARKAAEEEKKKKEEEKKAQERKAAEEHATAELKKQEEEAAAAAAAAAAVESARKAKEDQERKEAEAKRQREQEAVLAEERELAAKERELAAARLEGQNQTLELENKIRRQLHDGLPISEVPNGPTKETMLRDLAVEWPELADKLSLATAEQVSNVKEMRKLKERELRYGCLYLMCLKDLATGAEVSNTGWKAGPFEVFNGVLREAPASDLVSEMMEEVAGVITLLRLFEARRQKAVVVPAAPLAVPAAPLAILETPLAAPEAPLAVPSPPPATLEATPAVMSSPPHDNGPTTEDFGSSKTSSQITFGSSTNEGGSHVTGTPLSSQTSFNSSPPAATMGEKAHAESDPGTPPGSPMSWTDEVPEPESRTSSLPVSLPAPSHYMSEKVIPLEPNPLVTARPRLEDKSRGTEPQGLSDRVTSKAVTQEAPRDTRPYGTKIPASDTNHRLPSADTNHPLSTDTNHRLSTNMGRTPRAEITPLSNRPQKACPIMLKYQFCPKSERFQDSHDLKSILCNSYEKGQPCRFGKRCKLMHYSDEEATHPSQSSSAHQLSQIEPIPMGEETEISDNNDSGVADSKSAYQGAVDSFLTRFNDAPAREMPALPPRGPAANRRMPQREDRSRNTENNGPRRRTPVDGFVARFNGADPGIDVPGLPPRGPAANRRLPPFEGRGRNTANNGVRCFPGIREAFVQDDDGGRSPRATTDRDGPYTRTTRTRNSNSETQAPDFLRRVTGHRF